MSATGALTTRLYVSPVRPATRTRAGYEALGSKTVTPAAIADFDSFLTAADAAIGATVLSFDQDTTTFTVTADQYLGAVFTLAGDVTEYTIVSHETKATDDVTPVNFTISPALDVAASDNTAATNVSQISALLLTQTDFDAIFNGDVVQISAGLAPLTADTDYYVIKSKITRKIQLAESPEQARSGDNITLTAALGAQTLSLSNWKLLGEIMSIGPFGRSYEVVTANNLADGATRKAKGSFDQGSLDFECLYDSRDVGAQVMDVAIDDTTNYAFYVDLPPDGDGNDGETVYFQALLTMWQTGIGGPNDMVNSNGHLEFDHNDPVRVAA